MNRTVLGCRNGIGRATLRVTALGSVFARICGAEIVNLPYA